MGVQVTSGAVSVGRQKLFHQQILNSSPLQMQIQSGLVTPQICGALPLFLHVEHGNGSIHKRLPL